MKIRDCKRRQKIILSQILTMGDSNRGIARGAMRRAARGGVAERDLAESPSADGGALSLRRSGA